MKERGDALIGYTGFVGGNILAQRPFDLLYNSKNILDIQRKKFDFVVCAGTPGTKWIANKNPEADLASIEKLMDNLKTVKCKKLALISTIDVYSPVDGVDEDSAINKKNLQPYAKHRRMLEEFAADNFDALIIRLPGIFGAGLKKNIIFDLMQGLPVKINPNSLMQFYWLNHIWADISKALENNLKIINFATEPIILKELAKEVFGSTDYGQETQSPAYYDMRTKYAPLWGMDKPYLYSKTQILEDLKTFTQHHFSLT
jgi:nucleoside-diphosphate-sugar epimerase